MMDAHLDGLLDELVATEPREAWDDVLARARHSRRRYAGVVAAVAVLVLAPATWAAVNAFEGTPAPQSIQQNFLQWDAQAAAREYALAQAGFTAKVPRAEADKAHGVLQLQTGDGPLDMWAAPATDGGTCSFIGWESDLNGADGTAYGYGGCVPATPQNGEDIAWGEVNLPPSHPNYWVLSGYVYGDAATVDVVLADGRTTSLPVVEGLFMAAFDSEVKIDSLTARDAGGNVVATSTNAAP
jgi:hypothetical protein